MGNPRRRFLFSLSGGFAFFLLLPFHLKGELSFPALTGNPRGFLFILLFGEKNEPRRSAARYRAFSLGRRRLARGLRNSLRSHSPRPLSALGCRPPGPIRAVSLFSLFVCLCWFPFCSLLTSLDSRSAAGMTEGSQEWQMRVIPRFDGESTAMVVFCYDRGDTRWVHQPVGKIYSTPKLFNASLAFMLPCSAALRYQLTACV